MNKSIAFALMIGLGGVLTPATASASFGCEVLLCLAASNGTPAECKPPLKKLFKRLAKGKSFPSCKMESGPDVGGGNQNASTPKAERGVAIFVPRHIVCEQWETSDRGGRYCPNDKQNVVGPFYDHSGKSCSDYFPRKAIRATDDPNNQIRSTCQRKSKRFVRVNGGGITGEYHYY